MKCTTRLKSLRLEAGLSQNGLAREADLDRATVSKAENGKDVRELTVARMLNVINEKLNLTLKADDVTAQN